MIHARGLVVTEKNFNQHEITEWGELHEETYELFKKMDGSLVIMFYYKDKCIFSTRGSFISQQALKAEEIFKKKYMDEYVNKNALAALKLFTHKTKS